ncbi:MAG: transporter [Candidatus Binatia bacterium]|nr:transporter [Candidatus Binatia bacterium]
MRVYHRQHLTVPLLLGILLVGARPVPLLASCGQAFCPIETSSIVENPLGAGQLYLNFVYEHIDQDIPYTGTNRVRVGRIPRFHDEISTRNNTYKFTLEYGVTSRLTVGALFPLLDRLHRHIDNEEQEVIGGGLGETEIVRVPNRWRYIEFGDMQLTARYLLLPQTTPYTPALSLIVGLKLPTGRTGVRNDDGEKAELTLQPGNGSWDGIVGVSLVKNFSVQTVRRETALAPVFISALGRFPVGTGKFGYEPGGEMFLNLGLAYPLLRRLDLLGQINFHYKDRDDVGHAPGVVQADTGREELFLSPGVRYRLTDSMAIYTLVQFAVYRRVNGIQLTSDWNFTSGIFYRFTLLS